MRSSVTPPGWTRLSRGMVIRAVIEARLLGRKLLTLDADVAILPAKTPDRPALPRPVRNGRPGDGLLEAERTLESGAAELEAARAQMPVVHRARP